FTLAPPQRSTLPPYTTLFRSHYPAQHRFGVGSRPKEHLLVGRRHTVRTGHRQPRHGNGGYRKRPLYAVQLLLPGVALRHTTVVRSEEHTSELQSRAKLVCRPL